MSALPRVQSAVQGQIPCGHVARHPLQSLQGAPLREPVGAGGLLRAVCVGRGLVQRPLLLRALAQRVSRGGNCTNTLVVLSQLGHHCSWGGVLVDEPDASRIVADLDAHAIDLTPVRRLPKGKVPTSYITLNQRNGSRSIVHYRDLPEYDFDAFATIDLGACDWLHFEGRDIDAAAMNPRPFCATCASSHLTRTSCSPGARQAPLRWAATAVSCKARPFRRRGHARRRERTAAVSHPRTAALFPRAASSMLRPSKCNQSQAPRSMVAKASKSYSGRSR